MPSDLKPILAGSLNSAPGISHAFFTRPGGVSEGIYKGLNVGIGSRDNPNHVRANRAAVAGHLGAEPDKLVTLYQVHSPDAVVVTSPLGDNRPEADAVVTSTPGLVIGVLTADCGPVLFADQNAGIIGAAHAGWKGATGGVLESTIEAMEELGAKRSSITAVLGPTISQENYEVGPEFIERLLALDPNNSKWVKPSVREDHGMFNMPGYIVERLKANGVSASWTGQCTYGDEENFFSYRRTTHRKEPDYGRQISAITLNRHDG